MAVQRLDGEAVAEVKEGVAIGIEAAYLGYSDQRRERRWKNVGPGGRKAADLFALGERQAAERNY